VTRPGDAAINQQHAAWRRDFHPPPSRRRRGKGEAPKMTRFMKFFRDDEGQDLLEYALLVALIALVAVIAVTAAGTSVNQIFTNIAAELAKAA
jgi:pilus assembly protein Flp/PilA